MKLKSETKTESGVYQTIKLFPNGKVAQAYRMGRRDHALEVAKYLSSRGQELTTQK